MSATTPGSHGFSQPPSASSRSTSAAVKPQMSMPAHPERGAAAPAGQPQHQAGGGIGQFGHADAFHRGHLPRVDRRHRGRLAPPGQHRDDPEPGPLDEDLGQGADHVDAAGIQADLLGRLPQRGADRAAVAVVDGAAGKAGWPACSRSPSLRWMNSKSGPSGPSPNRTSTADGLPPVAGGASGAGTSIVPAASASRSSQDGAGRGWSAGSRPGVTRTGRA